MLPNEPTIVVRFSFRFRLVVHHINALGLFEWCLRKLHCLLDVSHLPSIFFDLVFSHLSLGLLLRALCLSLQLLGLARCLSLELLCFACCLAFELFGLGLSFRSVCTDGLSGGVLGFNCSIVLVSNPEK